MAEQEQRNLASVSDGVAKYLRRGQLCGLAVSFAALGVVAFTAHLGHPVVATILGGATLTGLVAVFVAGRPGGDPDPHRSDSEPRKP